MFHIVRTCLDEMNPYSLLPDVPEAEFYGEDGRILRPWDTIETVAGRW